MISNSILRALLVLIILASPVLAQTPAPKPKSDEERRAQKELERKTLGMLDEVIKDADGFKHVENRVRVKAFAAFFLWKHDEPRARALFREAIAALSDFLGADTGDDSPPVRNAFSGPRQLRDEMLEMLAKRDAKLARELFRSSKAKTAEGDGGIAETQMDLSLAMQIAADDPKLAADIARDSMAHGLSYPLPNVVEAIRHKDTDAAGALASDILAKLRTEKLGSNEEARGVALGLLRVVTQSPEQGGESGAKIVKPLLDQMAIRELTEMVTTEALRSPAQNAEMLAALQTMLPVVEQYAPGRVEQLRAKLPKGEEVPQVNQDPNDWAQYSELFANGSVDDLLAAAPKAPRNVRDVLYQQAAMKLMSAGEADRARQLITEKIRDSPEREQMFRDLEKFEAVAAAATGKLEDSQKVLATLKTPEERAMMLVELSAAALARGDKKVALQFLDEARGLTARRAKNIKHLAAQLLVAKGYATLDPSRSLALLEPIVDQLNDLLAAATVLGGFFVEELVRDDEIMLGPISMLWAPAAVHQYVGDLRVLARADFDRTKALMDRFQRDEIRILMRLILAQTILDDTAQSSASDILKVSPAPNAP